MTTTIVAQYLQHSYQVIGSVKALPVPGQTTCRRLFVKLEITRATPLQPSGLFPFHQSIFQSRICWISFQIKFVLAHRLGMELPCISYKPPRCCWCDDLFKLFLTFLRVCIVWPSISSYWVRRIDSWLSGHKSIKIAAICWGDYYPLWTERLMARWREILRLIWKSADVGSVQCLSVMAGFLSGVRTWTRNRVGKPNTLEPHLLVSENTDIRLAFTWGCKHHCTCYA